ncbi:MAG: glycerol-3-phosphate 1-O-acyltransferase PlsY [Clostridia bacterium]|nr:glycerol-3-phosphate 1-O-acyltransferase PlsY [Clostridia bacterium]MBQ3849313.1 glycerol-3-phosphate 1-O-acyltransferase PlsY [Clostridia bacterium]MBR3459290.1 glycerol-3-phosphate 1-O-acyltransferase PlsY [Clostridia bacterium]MBR5713697.1 glycerol-3-phosphate 1-O-acyltransferase PlsY [Clostridia bacterium]MBR5717733.1 glycerol-3-phosphate 1-O-acyltransferase PlsY [Clostridia bacterium]
MVIKVFISLIIGYLLGSVVTAILLSKLFFKEDIRTKGSGNSGATNAARVYGLPVGVFTFAGDFIKGILACVLGNLIGGDVCLAVAAAACMIGHCYPCWFELRGGKGVSVGAAIACTLDWRVALVGLCVFLAVVLSTRIVSISSILGMIAVGIAILIFKDSVALRILGVFAAIMVVIRHTGNIDRLIKGTEKKFTLGGH